ncbi:GAF domain-containing sensor histidine kinase [Thermogemmatispora onikobensis]|uniref:GAF domain-containing sensor histidine kinase n=1 Tax=Thermogemmatispora onikobensis TaxID=732234 RepID=UPI000852AAF4|nr:GAF domain-containing sensor histidine kinase [Thermogemmatispora onikobensis]
MRTVVTKRLTPSYLRQLYRESSLEAGAAALTVLLSLLWMALRLGGSQVTALFADAMYSFCALGAAAQAALTVWRSRYGPLRLTVRYQLAWSLVSIALLLDALGGLLYFYRDWTGQANTVPSVADVAFLLNYLLVASSQLFILSGFKLRRAILLILLDSLITTLCLLGIIWFFLVGPSYTMLRHSGIDLATLTISLSYPFLDLLLVLTGAMLLTLTQVERPLRPSRLLLTVGAGSLLWADSWYCYLVLHQAYVSGTPYVDTGWLIFFALLGLNASWQYTMLAQHAYHHQAPVWDLSQARGAARHARAEEESPANDYPADHVLLFQSLLIYLPFTIEIVLTLYSSLIHDGVRAAFLDTLTAAVAICLFLRYLLTDRQNSALLREREGRRQEAERLRLLTAQLNEILELNPLLERTVSLAPAALGCEAALLLIQEQAPFPEMPASVKVYVAARPAGQVILWRFEGQRLDVCTLLQPGELEVGWPVITPEHLPEELLAWYTHMGIRQSLVMPLLYQEKHLANLIFCSRSDHSFSRTQKTTARAFAEQAATALEHAFLYQEAREQEAFAQALANIATRLNSAIVEPTEIHQIICREGANALDADYVLLYTPDQHGCLLPQAIAASAGEPSSELSEWPVIYEHEYEAQALASPQPMLMPLTHFYQLDPPQPPVSLALQARAAAVGATAWPPHPPRRQRMHRALSLREMLARRYVPTAILAPLFSRNVAVGLLVLARSLRPGTQERQPLGLPDLPRAQGFAEQAAVAYTNATLYQQLRTTHQQLQELDQLKDQFMITASHELRTPLTAVQGYLELLAQYDEVLSPEQRHEFLHKTRLACDELVLLLNNVMDASRLEVDAGIRPAHIETVAVEDIVQSVVDMMEPQLTQEERIVYLDIPPDLAVQADPVRLRQILRNLAMNAIKYSPPGTPITFRARASLDSASLRPCALISVSDRGKGIRPEDQPKLFQRFVRLESDVNSPVRGSGLGLYISRRLVEAMRGKIWVESSGVPGEGATFTIELPLMGNGLSQPAQHLE